MLFSWVLLHRLCVPGVRKKARDKSDLLEANLAHEEEQVADRVVRLFLDGLRQVTADPTPVRA